jgi:hypothetical protein
MTQPTTLADTSVASSGTRRRNTSSVAWATSSSLDCIEAKYTVSVMDSGVASVALAAGAPAASEVAASANAAAATPRRRERLRIL